MDSLALIFNTTCHHEADQQGACAMAFGFASETHLALVLEKLEALLKAEFSKKRGLSASTFFGFMRDSKLEEGQLQIRCTILRCVGKKASFFVHLAKLLKVTLRILIPLILRWLGINFLVLHIFLNSLDLAFMVIIGRSNT